MEKISIMINGLPGNVAKTMVSGALKDNRFQVIPYSLTGPDIDQAVLTRDGIEFFLVKPDQRDQIIQELLEKTKSLICIDYTHPSAVNDNADFYVRHNIPFVMGTTGGDRKALALVVENGQTPAVIAPNMAKQIVGLQAMMDYGARTFPDLFAGYTLKVKESHQHGKADTSGTAKAMVGYFNGMGANFSVDQIEKIRDPLIQENEWKIPNAHLAGHGWHTYTLTSPDDTVLFEFKHNINGREIYVPSTLDAVVFLNGKLNLPDAGKRLYTMIDVLKKA